MSFFFLAHPVYIYIYSCNHAYFTLIYIINLLYLFICTMSLVLEINSYLILSYRILSHLIIIIYLCCAIG